jgi:hypothetical protein
MSSGALRTLCVSLWHVSQILYLGARFQAHAKIQAIRPSEAMIGSPVVAIRIKDGRFQKHEDTLLDMNNKEVSLDQMNLDDQMTK